MSLNFLFKMEYNLLLSTYDFHCNLFIAGKIPLHLFLKIETEYIKRYQLFIINLN